MTPPRGAQPAAGIDPGKVVRATLASAIVPGAGHLLLGRRKQGALIFVLTAALVAISIHHLAVGLAFFETDPGSLLFAVLLRAVAIIYAFAAVDTYLLGVDPELKVTPRRRQAVLLNLLIPGVGYLLARAWLRAAVGLLVLGFVFYFATVRKHPYLDAIYVGMQLIMAGFVYHYMRLEAARAAQGGDPTAAPQLPPPPRLPKVAAAQIVVLVALVAAVLACGVVVLESLPDGSATGLTEKDIQSEVRADGIHFKVPKLGLSMTAVGPGWRVSTQQTRFLFSVEHERGPTLMVGIQPIPPFVRSDRYIERVRRWMESNKLSLERRRDLEIDGMHAVQMHFSGDHWTVAIPRAKVAFLVMLGCRYESCADAKAMREKTRDSLRLER